MTRGTVTVGAQWALEGKRPDGKGYRVLACSTGELDQANFADALSRFQPGELSDLPQVSVSYARFGTQPGPSYLALAIHWYAAEGQRYADGVSQRDSQGRLTAYTSYFCLPYLPLAKAAIGYQAMFDALRAKTLKAADGPPIDVEITAPASRIPDAGPLAMRVAALLLAGHRVCVLGADGTSMPERLEFIDTVMMLLPYGRRSRMAAATWTKASNRSHRFRLFFSGSAPSGEAEIRLVMWDEPDQIDIRDDDASDYLSWLQDNIGALARLSELTQETGFGREHLKTTVDSLLSERSRRWSWGHTPRALPAGGTRRAGEAAPRALPAKAPPLPRALAGDPAEEALRDCAYHMKEQNPARLRGACADLEKIADDEVPAQYRARYQELASELRLLRPWLFIDDRHLVRVYGAVLRVAFGAPLSYQAYCQVQRAARVSPGDSPHPQLLSAILKTGADPLVSAILYWHLDRAGEKKLSRWLDKGDLDVTALIGMLAEPWDIPQHARIACDVTLTALKRKPRDSGGVRQALRANGFLAQALLSRHSGDDDLQVQVLYQFLMAAYPREMKPDGQDIPANSIEEILNGGGPPPTPALLTAVLISLERPESCQRAWDAYIRGITHLRINETALDYLRKRLPPRRG